jgi:hypothetical protein
MRREYQVIIRGFRCIGSLLASQLEVHPASQSLVESSVCQHSGSIVREALGSQNKDKREGAIEVGKFAGFAVLSADYFMIPKDAVKQIESILTLIGGTVVCGSGKLERLAPSPSLVSPPWSPVGIYSEYPHSHCC